MDTTAECISFTFCFSRYDFSEAQFGKDVCDRIISPLKGALRRYCDEGHDILTTSDMYQALQARQVKGTTAAVCEIDYSHNIKVDRIGNFSAFHNFSYEAEGVRVSKAYGIGPGKLIPWSQLNVQGQGPILVKEVSEQGFFTVSPRRMKQSVCETQESEKEAALFECKEPGCSYVFTTFVELQDHIHFGEHVSTRANQESIYDRLRRDWALKFATMSIDSGQKLPPTEELSHSPSGVSKPEARGWALQKPRVGGTRFSENVKSYLTARFDVGTQTGRKADPSQVAADMRTTRNADGSRRFSRDEWLTNGTNSIILFQTVCNQ